jgi:hypothetical protein
MGDTSEPQSSTPTPTPAPVKAETPQPSRASKKELARTRELQEAGLVIGSDGKPKWDDLHTQLRYRSLSCVKIANAAFACVMLVAVMGVVFFIFSGTLVQREADEKSRDDVIAMIGAVVDVAEIKKFRGEFEAMDGGIQPRLADALDRVESGRTRLALEQQSREASKQARTSTEYLISLLAVRAGVAALVIFLCQVFVGVYRYNRRLAAFYDARADALQLGGHSELPKAALKALDGERVTYGPDPKSPALGVSEKLATGLKKKTERPKKETPAPSHEDD